ncbi:GNAT family N-acetyltransferase [Stagnihabitans tardus]|uniref:L-ornithine N(alpha)-acyltransferase n=1 Tax=Stagnihabitans tardus TaxID=2699202 RepID=A0AAE4YDM8_9RHOB|nr:GNAT family N-acyltransferase [Stagnihabitans tardus]NBZ89531.1 GNAT family N-acetyltransferase [Stagnihabitans tardus]
MTVHDLRLTLRLARDGRDLAAAQRLRYEVFVRELGADGPGVDHAARLESDAFDPLCDHLLLIDPRRDPATLSDVVGVYRLLPPGRTDRYYSEAEFDLSALRASGRRLLELGRSCVHRDHRGGTSMLMLWNGLADYVQDRGIEVLFGPASFHGTDVEGLAKPLSWLWHNHRAPEALRVTPLSHGAQRMDLCPPDCAAHVPALIKAYLRLGGHVSDGAFIDRDFNTVDVCLVMDTAQMSARRRDFHIRKGREA